MRLDSILIGALTLAVLASCSNQEEPTPPTPAAAPEAASPSAAASPNSSPQTQVSASSTVDPTAALSQADAALKAKEYERAVQAMLVIQQAQLNEQQAQAARNQMTRLQNDLAAAVARGDPRAKTAADLLRRSASGGR